jgi:hypothetical protein
MQHERNGQLLLRAGSHEHVNCVPIPGELALVAIAKATRAIGYALGTLARDDHALDCIRRRDRSDARVLRKTREQFRRLVLEQLLSASRGVDAR